MPRRIPAAVQQRVRERANYLCEYCHTSEHWQAVRFTIDHVLPTAEGGEDAPENLALACFHCNRRKSDKRSAVDLETGQPFLYSILACTTGQSTSSGQPMDFT